MIKTLKKLIPALLVIIILFNAICPPVIALETVDDEDMWDKLEDAGFSVLDGIVGVLTWIPRALLAVVLTVGQTVVSFFVTDNTDPTGLKVDIEDIIFAGGTGIDENKIHGIQLLDVNFFNFSSGDQTAVQLRNGVAKWYYALRNIAMVISLVVLLYIGIRMAISTVASDKAMYKKMLMDWATSFALLFVLHYIMVIVVNLNNQLVGLLGNSLGDARLGSYEDELITNVFSPSFVKGWGSLVVELIFFGVKMMFFVLYVRRVFTIGFLIAISPLITITYSIDKLGDQKSQALDTWLKEFIFNVLIQPFHCIIYLMFVTTAIGMLNTGELRAILLAALAIMFMHKAEDIVKKIFGFEKASSLMGAAAAGAMVSKALEKGAKATSSAKSVKNQANGAKSGKNGITRKNSAGAAAAAQGGGQGGNTLTLAGGTGGSQSTNGTTNSTANNTANGTTNGTTSNANPYTAPLKSAGSAIKGKISNGKDAVKAGLHNLKTNPLNTLGRVAKGAGNAVAQMNIRTLAKAMKVAPRVGLGLMTAGATGDAISGFVAAKAYKGSKYTRQLGDKLEGKADDLNAAHKAKNETSKFEAQESKEASKLGDAYQNYKMANPNMTDEELSNKSQELLDADVNSIDDKNEKAFAQSLQNLQNTYAKNQVEDPKQRVLDTVKDVQAGNIKSKVSIKTKAISNAIDKLQEQNSAFKNKETTMTVSKEFMQDIDVAKAQGEKYLNTEKYKALSSAEKDLAKEIYKTKEVLSAIGDNKPELVNRQIESTIENKFNENQ